ncbi:phage baseplate assembly protein V [Rapidithrix thailandica]|uniref:Phage baseplate assembly protein V n=1 Tax=Rapidithrix thailandica TaxID=413964 RepID=A0AAW9SLC1_9BACT
MAKPVNTQILLNGSPILVNSNYSIELEQQIASHHKLTITCPTESMEDVAGSFAMKAKDYIGNRLTLLINEDQLVFTSVVVNVNIHKYDGGDGLMVITAFSPTVLMAHGRDSQSFEKKDLKGIISEATKEYPSDIVKIESKPHFQDSIPYTVQYKENDFDFICRLAKRYGEWVYYDGETLHFGNHGSDTVPLNFGEALSEFNFSMQAKPQHHTYLVYDSLQAKIHNASMEDHRESVSNPYIRDITKVSEKLFAKKPTAVYNNSLLENGKVELENVVKLKAKHALNTMVFEGKSDEVQVALGNLVEVTGKSTSVAGQTDVYGNYIITSVTHKVNNSGEYINTFEGVPSDIQVPVYFDEDAIPVCEEQYAEVKDNNDPDGLGRIRVQFPWQALNNQLSPWLRVSTPYAGDGKGFHVLPEVGEEVLIGFESGNAEKPFVIGAMFHGKGKSGRGGAGNYVKGLTTASGTKVEMDDENSTVTIYDPSGNTVTLNGDGTITIAAPDKIDIQSKEINITGEDKVVISTKSAEVTGTEIVSVNSNSVIENNSGDKVSIGAETLVEVGSKAGNVNVTGGNMTNIKGNSSLNLN